MPRRTVAALLTHAALIQAVTFLLRPASTYRGLELDVPASALGLVGATFAVVPLVLAVPVGRWVDGIGERAVMVTGSVLVVGASAVFVVVPGTVAALVVANALLGAGHLLCVIGQQAFIANTAVSHRLDSMFGYYGFMASLGQAVGPLLIAVVGGRAVQPATGPIFATALGVSLGLLALATLTASSPRRGGSQEPPEPVGTVALMRTPGLPRTLVASAVVLSAVDLTLIYLPALGAERGLTAAAVGTLLTVRAVSSMASRLVLGRLSRLLGRTRLMVGSIGLSAGSLGLLAAPLPLWALVAVVALAGLGLGIGQPLTMSWLTEQSPPGSRGRAMSLRLAGNRIGQIAIPSTLGLVAAGTGAGAVFVATAATLAATGLLLRGLSLEP